MISHLEPITRYGVARIDRDLKSADRIVLTVVFAFTAGRFVLCKSSIAKTPDAIQLLLRKFRTVSRRRQLHVAEQAEDGSSYGDSDIFVQEEKVKCFALEDRHCKDKRVKLGVAHT